MTDKIVVLSTCASTESAEMLARALVSAQLAACVSVVPQIRSFYHWDGKLEDAEEVLLIIKTSRSLFDAVKLEMEKLHNYDLPELIALPIVAGSENYLMWLAQNLRKSEAE